MARAPRGPTGSVHGTEPSKATKILSRLVLELGPTFTRAAAADWLRQYDWPTPVIEAWLATLARCPGVHYIKADVTGVAHYVAKGALAHAFVRNRMWRMACPRLDVADAVALVEILTLEACECTPNLHRLRMRLDAALAEIL